MNIDFTEIPAGNKGGKGQDTFELFACDFLESLGYEIIQRPSRGPDGKKDLIVQSNSVPGTTSDSKTKWLVSCKHHAHSNKGVNDTDEPDISDRVKKHKCHGFLGFYSTIPTTTLSDKLAALGEQIVYTLYDQSRIEKEIHHLKDKERILAKYFPESKEKWERKNNASLDLSLSSETKEENDICKFNPVIAFENQLEITRTALIQIDIAKIISEFTYKWEKSEALLDKFYVYVDFRNETIANDILRFLNVHVSYGARVQMPSSVAGAVHSLALTFFPSSYGEEEKEMRIKNGEQCIFAGAELAYGAFIYSGNYRVAAWGMNIWKYIYQESKRKGYTTLIDLVLKEYEGLESTLKRPERNDLGPARKLVKIFKEDINTSGLSFPVLPPDLYELIEKCD